MKARSPVLGYNHNVRYAGRMWHVQTEDSGVQNPHLFTHLFHDGTILATKKLDYDASSDVSAVQKLMQSQHKLMLRELKSGVFDAKIEQYFGPIVRDPGDADPAQAQAREDRATVPDLGAFVSEARAEPITEPELVAQDYDPIPVTAAPEVAAPPPAVAQPRMSPPPAAVIASSSAPPRPRAAALSAARPAVTVTAARANAKVPAAPPPTLGARGPLPAAPPRPPPPTIGARRSGSALGNRPTAEGVIVARPTVIVGQGGPKPRAADDFWKTERRSPPDPAFGGDLISEKSLDEVILAYLSEDAPKK